MIPDNTIYMVVAYVAAGWVLAGYLASLRLRTRAMAARGDAIDSVTRS